MENNTEHYPTPQYTGILNTKIKSNQLSEVKTEIKKQPHQPETYLDKKGNSVTPPYSKPTMYWEGDKPQPAHTSAIETEFLIK